LETFPESLREVAKWVVVDEVSPSRGGSHKTFLGHVNAILGDLGRLEGLYDFIIYSSQQLLKSIGHYLVEFNQGVLPTSAKEMDTFTNMVDLSEVVGPALIDMKERNLLYCISQNSLAQGSM